MILGLDSAPRRTGWALVQRNGSREELVAYGVIVTCDPATVHKFANDVMVGPKRIERVAIEDCYLEKNVDTLKKLARLTGRWQQEFETRGLLTELVMADVWQRGVLRGLIASSSPRAARKAAAQKWVKWTYTMSVEPDEADAICLATWMLRARLLISRVSSSVHPHPSGGKSGAS